MENNMSRTRKGLADKNEIEQILAMVNNTTFDINDWNLVITECSSLAAEWDQLSAYLGISANMIDIIKRDNLNKASACWNEALKQWIMQNYRMKKFDKPSWRTLLKAIAKVDKLQFKELAEKYQGQAKPDKSESDGERNGAQGSNVSTSKQDSAPSDSPHFTFPFLNLREMDKDEKEQLHQRLFSESENMEYKFQELFKAIRRSMVDRQISVRELLKHLDCLGSIKPLYKGSKLPVFGCQVPRLIETENVDNAMSVISSYCSFFNYRIVECIIENLGTEQDKTNLKQYKEEFRVYAQHHVFQCPAELGEISEDGHANMFVTLDLIYDSYNISHLCSFVSNLQRVLKIPAISLRLCRIGPGSLKLIFQLPNSVQQLIFPISSDQIADLSSLGVMELSCGDYQYIVYKEVVNHASDEHLKNTNSDTEPVSIQAGGLAAGKPEDTSSITTGDSALGKSSYTSRMTEFSEGRDFSMGMGHDITARDGHGNSSGVDSRLHKASLNGNLQEVKRLMEEEHLNPLQRVGKTASNALHYAAAQGHIDVLRYFIEDRGCNAACVDQDGWTPLHYAALHKHLDIVQYLIEKQQVEPFSRSNAGTTALHHACIGGSIDVICYLAKEMSKYLPVKDIIEDRDHEGIRPLYLAASRGHLKAVIFLITELNADPNATVDTGEIALHTAIYAGHSDVVKYLIEHHQQHCDHSCCTMDPRGWHSRELLELAHDRGHHHIVQYLKSISS